MDILVAILLGIVQGLAEFLPISSSGHLVVFQKLFGVAEHDLTFDIVVHLATLLSVLTVMRKPIFKVIGLTVNEVKRRQLGNGTGIALKIIVGTIPAAIVGLTLKDEIEELFSSTFATGVFFSVTGVLLLISRFISTNDDEMSLDDTDKAIASLAKTSYLQSLLVGTFQAFAIAPGVSRSGSTIVGGLLLKLDKTAAAYFSFMLAIPAILGAGVLQLRDLNPEGLLSPHLIAGFFGAYLSGVFALQVVLKLVKSGRLDFFAYYLFVLSIYTIFFL